MKKGFTLIELLIVVAIIAIVGAGVGVVYNRLDERAKTAMEINDCSTLKRIISQWSFLHDCALPNYLDSLVDSGGRLFSRLDNESGIGLSEEAAYTFSVETAPDRAVENLVAAGLTRVYLHKTDSANANDSTFTNPAPGAKTFDTSETAARLVSDEESQGVSALSRAESDGTWWDYDNDGPFTVAGKSYYSLSDFVDAINKAREFQDAVKLEKLVFINPDGGVPDSERNIAAEIIVSCGLFPDDVARPSENAATAISSRRKCYLAVFGLGRFAEIYDGKGVRVEAPASGKRFTNPAVYSRYLAVVRIPVGAYDASNQTDDNPRIVAVLSPQGLTTAHLEDLYREEVAATGNQGPAQR